MDPRETTEFDSIFMSSGYINDFFYKLILISQSFELIKFFQKIPCFITVIRNR